MSINIGSANEWQSLLSGTNVVVADFYADWCGPCKMIAPHFEKLAKEHSRPKKVAFAKINVDSQSTIAQSNAVAAMPTFKIFHNGTCIDTIKGANPPALTEAITKAVKLAGAGGAPGQTFKTPGRTLGGAPRAGARGAGSGFRIPALSITGFFNAIIVFVGLYLVSLFSFDPYKSAEKSMFNIYRKPDTTGPRNGGSGAKPGAKPPAKKPAFRTLADLGGEKSD